jgi:uncharacterized protein (DUF1778 family)
MTPIRSATIAVRVTDKQKRRIIRAAKALGLTLSTFAFTALEAKTDAVLGNRRSQRNGEQSEDGARIPAQGMPEARGLGPRASA